MDGFKYIFDDAENLYKNIGPKLDSFRFERDIYGFCINEGPTDNQSLYFANKINNELCEKFKNQPKGLTGYKGNENKYIKYDDLDSKHICQLTFLFNKLNITNYDRIVEIGGGFGNMCRLCNNIVSYNNWDIVDLPHMLELSNYYLQNEIKNISKINFINAYSNINYNNIDLVIGTHSVSEFSWDVFYNYFQSIISKSKYFYMGYNKNCPSPDLINKKINFILDNGFELAENFDYTEPLGANVSYSLYKKKSNSIFAIGDSHCIYYFDSIDINHHWFGMSNLPVTIYKLIEQDIPLYNIVEKLPPGDICQVNIKSNDFVLFCYGWNDIQKNIKKYSKDNYKNLIDYLVINYIKIIKKYSDGTLYQIRPIVNCIYPIPISTNDSIFGSDEERIEYTLYMNEKLKSECLQNDIPFFDIYDIISDNSKLNKNVSDIDGTHLDRKNSELRIMIENKLKDTITNFYKS